jgi:hypothetical protein
MSRRDKARNRAEEILRRNTEPDHTSHLTALRTIADEPSVAVDPDLPVFADTCHVVGIVPEPAQPWNDHTALLPLVDGPADAALVGA